MSDLKSEINSEICVKVCECFGVIIAIDWLIGLFVPNLAETLHFLNVNSNSRLRCGSICTCSLWVSECSGDHKSSTTLNFLIQSLCSEISAQTFYQTFLLTHISLYRQLHVASLCRVDPALFIWSNRQVIQCYMSCRNRLFDQDRGGHVFTLTNSKIFIV